MLSFNDISYEIITLQTIIHYTYLAYSYAKISLYSNKFLFFPIPLGNGSESLRTIPTICSPLIIISP